MLTPKLLLNNTIQNSNNSNNNISHSKTKKNLYNTMNTINSKKKKTIVNMANTMNTINSKKKKKIVSMMNTMNTINSKKKKKIINMNYESSNGMSNGMSNVDSKKKKKIIGTIGSMNMSDSDGKKKKKKLTSLSGIPWAEMNDETRNRIEVTGIKKELLKLRYGNFYDINVSDRTPFWGLGVEHEMQLLHKARSGMKNTNILFDSQESTCFLSGDEQACKKLRSNGGDDFTELSKKYGSFGLTGEELQYLRNMQWELSGRQIVGCRKRGVPSNIVKRTPILMPELISTNFSNRTIDSIAKEIIDLENHFIKIHMKNPHTKQKVDMYGPLTTHFCGASSEILIPEHPTINAKKYKFQTDRMTDYLGSYHITITLPHTQDIGTKEFVKMHQNMAQQLQWIEPLLVTGFFSPTQKAVGNPNEPEGSFRVMSVGWGNFAGSDVRKMGTEGLNRATNLKSTWRNGIEFTGTKKLNYCSEKAPPQYKKAKSVHTGDFRTFGFEFDIPKCEKLYNPNDCPRADGKPMEPPFGMEIRIFDHFPAEYLIELLRIIVLLGANAQRSPANEYVYTNKIWKDALHSIMKDGWNAIIDSSYVSALRKNLGLPIHTMSTLAYDVLKQIVKELFEINKDSFINKIMNEHTDIEPTVPEINRICWDMAFTQQFNGKVINFLKRSFHNKQEVSITDFTRMLKEDGVLEFENWKHDLNDLLYALETHNHVQLTIFNSKIKSITILI